MSFSRKELFLWLGVVFLTMVWMFILGIIVGRGLSPVKFDVEKLQRELVALKEEALKVKADAESSKAEVNDTHLGFYDILTEKKEMARLKSKEPSPDISGANSERVSPLPPAAKTESKQETAVANRKGSVSAKAADPPQVAAGYTLQIASFRDTGRADNFVSTLESKGYDAYQVAAHVHGKGIYHRVRIGRFRTKQEAQALLARLREDDLNPLVIRE